MISAAPAALSASHVTFGYGRTDADTSFVLQDITLEIPPGTLTGVLGPNGCGKTTLLRLLSGVLRPDAGEVRLDGRDVHAMARRAVARRIAVVPQETHPAFDYSALEMVLMGRHPHLGVLQLEGPEDLAIAHDALRATGTAHLAARSYMTLSGGEKQRVIIASALAQGADVLLLDEPTASLDIGYQLEVADLLKALRRERGVTIVMATHDLNLAASTCDWLVLLRGGRLLDQGPTADVLTPAAIASLYGVDAEVQLHAHAGHLLVTPLRRRTHGAAE